MLFHAQRTKPARKRRLIALLLAIIYLVIALSPLAPLAMSSKRVVHAVTGECAGDCRICGCSQESRLSGTCCCARKRALEMRAYGGNGNTCCGRAGIPAPQSAGSCCRGSHSHDSGRTTIATAQTGQSATTGKAGVSKSALRKDVTVLTCGCPCGRGKLLDLAGLGSFEIILTRYRDSFTRGHVIAIIPDLTMPLLSLSGKPPIPPPKLPFLS